MRARREQTLSTWRTTCDNRSVRTATIMNRIRKLALSFPKTREDHPWGDFPVFKVGDNSMFAMAYADEDGVHVTLKLTPEEREVALLLPWVSVARYVGRYGWVTAQVTDAESLANVLEWMRESYYLKAPAKLRDAAFSD